MGSSKVKVTSNSSDYGPDIFAEHYHVFFNAFSFTAFLGSPLILYAKHLGASSTVLGLIAAIAPILVMLQIPGAYFIPRLGYKKFALLGWGWRTVFIFLAAGVGLLQFTDPGTRLVLLIFALIGFNIIRGLSTSAWLPWISQIVPEGVRGAFFAREAFASNLGSLLAVVVASLLVGGAPKDWQFSLVFFFAGISALISLRFLCDMPEAPCEEAVKKSSTSVPWAAMLAYKPFSQFLWNYFFVMFALAAIGVFSVEFLRDALGFGSDKIILLGAAGFVGAMSFLPLFGRVVDRCGSQPVILVSVGVIVGCILVWALIAGGLLLVNWFSVGILNFLMGLASAAYNAANNRIGVAIIPEMGRNHFFALFSVVTSVGVGVSPVIWGLVLDFLSSRPVSAWGVLWNGHSIVFGLLSFVALATLFSYWCSRSLSEQRLTLNRKVNLQSSSSSGDWGDQSWRGK